jgi:hypothetical protein
MDILFQEGMENENNTFIENENQTFNIITSTQSQEQMPNIPNPECMPSQPIYVNTMDHSQEGVNSTYRTFIENDRSKINSDSHLRESANVTQSHADSSPFRQNFNEQGICSSLLSKTVSREVSKPVSHQISHFEETENQ